jgi:hypothetical protein
LSSPAAGYQLTYIQGQVTAAFLYTEPAEGFTAFPGPLTGGVLRGSTRPEMLTRFGTPERSGSTAMITGLGRQGARDRFEVGGVRVHFQYAGPGEHVQLVAIMIADEAP